MSGGGNVSFQSVTNCDADTPENLYDVVPWTMVGSSLAFLSPSGTEQRVSRCTLKSELMTLVKIHVRALDFKRNQRWLLCLTVCSRHSHTAVSSACLATAARRLQLDSLHRFRLLMPLDTAGHTAPILIAFIGNQETEERVREERALLHERYNSNVVNHRSQEVLLLHLGARVFYELSCLSGLQTFRVLSSSFLNSDRAEQFRRCFSWYVDRSCQDVSVVTSD